MIEQLKSLKLQFLDVLAILELLVTFAYFFWISGKINTNNHNIAQLPVLDGFGRESREVEVSEHLSNTCWKN